MNHNINNFHFLGICGTAMGAVAAAMHQRGYKVSGCDSNVYPPMSTFLEQQGISITQGYQQGCIPEDTELVVIGNAMSRGNPAVEEVLRRKLAYMSLPEVLKHYFLQGRKNFVVSGTHGKTTTSSLLAWIFSSAGLDPSFMIGGIPRNFDTGGRLTSSQYSVLEGDEYDTAFFDKRSKFLHYLPELVIVNNIEFDHADIYANLDEIKLSFRRLLSLVPTNGQALLNGDDLNCWDIAKNAPCPLHFVGFGHNCDLRIEMTLNENERSHFTINSEPFSIPMTGVFNVRNAAMAICAAKFAGIESSVIQQALDSFSGVARRQELRGVAKGISVIDDFAHHPTAIAEAIGGLRQRFAAARLWVIFEPRSNTTRRNIFQQDLADALGHADIAIVAKVEDPQKVEAQHRLDVEKLIASIRQNGGQAELGQDVDSIIEYVLQRAESGDVIAIMSNGGFGEIHNKLLLRLQNS